MKRKLTQTEKNTFVSAPNSTNTPNISELVLRNELKTASAKHLFSAVKHLQSRLNQHITLSDDEFNLILQVINQTDQFFLIEIIAPYFSPQQIERLYDWTVSAIDKTVLKIIASRLHEYPLQEVLISVFQFVLSELIKGLVDFDLLKLLLPKLTDNQLISVLNQLWFLLNLESSSATTREKIVNNVVDLMQNIVSSLSEKKTTWLMETIDNYLPSNPDYNEVESEIASALMVLDFSSARLTKQHVQRFIVPMKIILDESLDNQKILILKVLQGAALHLSQEQLIDISNLMFNEFKKPEDLDLLLPDLYFQIASTLKAFWGEMTIPVREQCIDFMKTSFDKVKARMDKFVACTLYELFPLFSVEQKLKFVDSVFNSSDQLFSFGGLDDPASMGEKIFSVIRQLVPHTSQNQLNCIFDKIHNMNITNDDMWGDDEVINLSYQQATLLFFIIDHLQDEQRKKECVRKIIDSCYLPEAQNQHIQLLGDNVHPILENAINALSKVINNNLLEENKNEIVAIEDNLHTITNKTVHFIMKQLRTIIFFKKQLNQDQCSTIITLLLKLMDNDYDSYGFFSQYEFILQNVLPILKISAEKTGKMKETLNECMQNLYLENNGLLGLNQNMLLLLETFKEHLCCQTLISFLTILQKNGNVDKAFVMIDWVRKNSFPQFSDTEKMPFNQKAEEVIVDYLKEKDLIFGFNRLKLAFQLGFKTHIISADCNLKLVSELGEDRRKDESICINFSMLCWLIVNNHCSSQELVQFQEKFKIESNLEKMMLAKLVDGIAKIDEQLQKNQAMKNSFVTFGALPSSSAQSNDLDNIFASFHS